MSSRVGGVEQLEEVDELAAAMAILDQGVDLAGQQVDAGQQRHGAVPLVFVVACEGRMSGDFGALASSSAVLPARPEPSRTYARPAGPSAFFSSFLTGGE